MRTIADFCCERMQEALTSTCPKHPDRHDCVDALLEERDGHYGILIHDGGSSMQTIDFCPFCGTKLPP